MRRLAVAAVVLLALGMSATLSLPAGGSPARTSIVAPGEGQLPELESLEALRLLELLDIEGPSPQPEKRRYGPVAPDHCFRESPGGPCTRVCTQFVTAKACERFPSAADGCLRYVAPRGSPCLDDPPAALPAGRPTPPQD